MQWVYAYGSSLICVLVTIGLLLAVTVVLSSKPCSSMWCCSKGLLDVVANLTHSSVGPLVID